jgi:hypothetical protein
VGKANTSVTGSTLDNGTAGLQQSLLLGILDDEESGPILDTTTRVLELRLA